MFNTLIPYTVTKKKTINKSNKKQINVFSIK